MGVSWTNILLTNSYVSSRSILIKHCKLDWHIIKSVVYKSYLRTIAAAGHDRMVFFPTPHHACIT